MPRNTRIIDVTEDKLDAIYHAARFGLTGDKLAYACDIKPSDFKILLTDHPLVQAAIEKGQADAELNAASKLAQIMETGDAKESLKAALAILNQRHNWTPTKKVDVDVDQQLSVSVALERARRRVIEATYTEVPEQELKRVGHNPAPEHQMAPGRPSRRPA